MRKNWRARFRFRSVVAIMIGCTAIMVANAAIVYQKDPLVYFSDKLAPSQPLFDLDRFGNFSRFVYTGLMRSVDYQEIWIGPSYVAPFGVGADHQRELVVSMGNMTIWELTEIIELERRLSKAEVVNIVISPQHGSEFFYGWAQSNVAFPGQLYDSAGFLDYLFGFQYARLGLAYISAEKATALQSEQARANINYAYFWMDADEAQLRAYWRRENQVTATVNQLAKLRENLRRLSSDDVGSAERKVSKQGALRLCESIGDVQAKVHVIFPPAHLSYWGMDFDVFLDALAVRRTLLECLAKVRSVKIFDYQSDWNLSTRRDHYYDAGHFSAGLVPVIRQDIAAGRNHAGSLANDVFSRFEQTGDAFVKEQISQIDKE